MLQLILHLFGDYILQSNWMAVNKRKRTLPCAIHCLTYTLPFLILTQSSLSLATIFVTHFLIDRYGLARYVVWLKNHQSPKKYHRWPWCTMTGYFDPEVAKATYTWDAEELSRLHSNPDEVSPVWLRIWLLIVADNTLHLAINYAALRWL